MPATSIGPTASLGFIGSVFFDNLDTCVADYTTTTGADPVPNTERTIRATNIGLQAKQTITKPPLVDARFDSSAYQLGPVEIEGDVAFPAAHDQAGSLYSVLWWATMKRDEGGILEHEFDVQTRYGGPKAQNYGSGNDLIFTYAGGKVNTFGMSVAQGGLLETTIGLICREKNEEASYIKPTYAARNSRLVTWNDVVLGFKVNETLVTNNLVTGEAIRSFSINVNNNLQRFYSLNQKLTPVDIAAGKREITGSLTALGRLGNLGEMARTNKDRCAEFSELFFGYRPQGNGLKDCTGGFSIYLPGVVFEIEQMSLTTELLESTINFHVLPGSYQDQDVSPFDPDPHELLIAPADVTKFDPVTFLYYGANFPDQLIFA